MSDEGTRQYFNVIPPVASTTPGVGVTYLAATTSAAKEDISSYGRLHGCLLELIASGDKIWITTSDDGAVAIDKSAAGATTFADGTAKKNGIPIGDGQVLLIRLDITQKYLHWQADSTTAVLIVRSASQQRVSDAARR